jgi:hypothetical protein
LFGLLITLVPVKTTGLGKMIGKMIAAAPVNVMLLPTWIEAALVKTRFMRGVVPPTAPVNEMTPAVPALNVSAVAPLSVLEKLMLAPVTVPPLFVLSNVGAPAIATGPVIVMTPPLVVTFPFTLIAVAPVYVNAPVVLAVELWVIVAEVTDKLVRGVVLPTAPVKVVVPVPPATVSACAPFTVLPKVTLALFEVIMLAPVKLTGLEKVRGLAPVSVILLPT